jgi:hypothetical protein
MTTNFEGIPGNFVVVFFHTRAGELCCRVTDVMERKTWIAEDASTIRHLLTTPRAPDATEKGEPHA